MDNNKKLGKVQGLKALSNLYSSAYKNYHGSMYGPKKPEWMQEEEEEKSSPSIVITINK